MPGFGDLVQMSGVTAGGVGIWTIVLLLIGYWGRDIIKNRPTLAKISIEADAAKRAADRADGESCQERIDRISARLDEFIARSMSFEMQLFAARAAYLIVVAELQSLNPDSLALLQAKALLDLGGPPTKGAR